MGYFVDIRNDPQVFLVLLVTIGVLKVLVDQAYDDVGDANAHDCSRLKDERVLNLHERA